VAAKLVELAQLASTLQAWPAVFLLACLSPWATRPATRRLAAVSAATIACAMLGAAAHAYPFASRLVLFLVPSAIWLTAAGFDALRDRVAGRRRVVIDGAAVVCGVALTLLAVRGIAVRGYQHDDARSVLAHVAAKWQPGDRLIVSDVPTTPFLYYNRFLGLPAGEAHLRAATAPALSPGRWWVVHTTPPWTELDAGQAVLAAASAQGRVAEQSSTPFMGATLLVVDAPAPR
jgi:hypothetical protein